MTYKISENKDKICHGDWDIPEKSIEDVKLKIKQKFRLQYQSICDINSIRQHIFFGVIDNIDDKFIYCHVVSNNTGRLLRKKKLTKKLFLKRLTHVYDKDEIKIPYETYIYFNKLGEEVKRASDAYEDMFSGKRIHFL